MYLVIIHPQLLLLLVAAVFCLFLRIECRLLSKRQIQGGYCAPLTVLSGQVSYLPSTGLLQSATIPSGTTAVLTCNSGYYPLGASSATCSNGIWNPALGTCQTSGLGTTNPFGVGIGTTSSSSLFGGQQCLPMLPPIGGQLSYSQGSQFGPFPAGSSVQLICSAGTVVSGSSQAFCQSGQWQPAQLGQCLSSGSLGTGTLGIGGTNGLTGGGVAPIGGCPPTIAPANGQVQYAGILQGGVYPSGTTATLFCLSGTPSNGQSTTVCRNSIWTPSLGFCTTAGTGVATISPGGFGVPNTLGLQQNSCLFGLLPPLGGTVQYSNQQQAISTTLPTGLLGSNTGSAGGPYPEGTFAILVCQQGISSGQQSICTGGQWQPPVLNGCSNTGLLGQPQTGLPGSTAGQCVLGLGVLGGNVVYSNTGTLGTSGLGTSATTSQFGPFPSGTIAQAQCLNGQFPSGGASQATCLNGQWQPSQLGQCLATGVVQANSLLPGATLTPFGTTAAFGTAGQTCIFGLLPPLNGRLQYSSAQTMGPFPAGTTASLLCNAGFVPNGQTSASCLNGQFQPTTLGQCIQSSANPTSNSANNNTSSSASTTRSSSPYSSSGGTTPAFQMWNSNNNNNNNGSNGQCFELPGANNGQFVYSPVGYKAPFPMGSTATLVCAEGTQMADGSTVGRSAICQSTGWSTLQFDPCLRMNASTRAAVFS